MLEMAGIVGIVTTTECGRVDGTAVYGIITIVENDGIGTYGTDVGIAVIGTITGDVGNWLCGGIVIDEMAGIVGITIAGIVEIISWLFTITIDGYPGTGKNSTDVGKEEIKITTGEYGNTDVGGMDFVVKIGSVEMWIVYGVDGTVTPGGKTNVGIDVGITVVYDGLITIVYWTEYV